MIEKKEVNRAFIEELLQRDNLDILYERTDYIDGKTKGILDDSKITRTYAMEYVRGKFFLKKFRVGKTNLIKNVISFIVAERSESYGYHRKLTWYEEI